MTLTWCNTNLHIFAILISTKPRKPVTLRTSWTEKKLEDESRKDLPEKVFGVMREKL